MDINTIIMVAILVAMFVGGVLWMEIHSRISRSKEAPNRSTNEAKETIGMPK